MNENLNINVDILRMLRQFPCSSKKLLFFTKSGQTFHDIQEEVPYIDANNNKPSIICRIGVCEMHEYVNKIQR